MKNPYLAHLEKLEFVLTDACTGRCKHCSQGSHTGPAARIDPALAAEAVRRIASFYRIKTVLAFGGEPLLHPDAIVSVMEAAHFAGIAHRQLITNGYVPSGSVARGALIARIAECGVNDLLLSVDAFHQETIPLDAVLRFSYDAAACGIPLRLQPAWLVSKEDENPYNRKTRALLAHFDPAVPVGEGNVIFPEGNARRYLAEYFTDTPPRNPYLEDLRDLRCLSFAANGDVLDGNLYQRDVMDILAHYKPEVKA